MILYHTRTRPEQEEGVWEESVEECLKTNDSCSVIKDRVFLSTITTI